MAVPNNILQQVQTYQMAELAWMLNQFCAVNMTNKKFQNFQDKVANLGDTVTFDLAPRYRAYDGLVITQQPSVQRLQSLSCTQALNISSSFTAQQFIFNVEDYMERFGESAAKEFGSIVETDILKNAISGVRINDPQNSSFGQLQTNSGPYRFFGDGVTQINSYNQLAQMIANFKNYGAAPRIKVILPDVAIPAIVGTGLNQFATNRNNEIANSWELGRFADAEWYTSNLLPTHYAGNVGNATGGNNVVTLVSTNDPTGYNVTQITVTEPTSSTDPDAYKAGDMLRFNWGVSGETNLFYLTFIGHSQSYQPVQIRLTADAATTSGSATLSIYPALVWQATQNQNLNAPLSAGMQLTVMPSHVAGLVYSGDQFYLAMPKLPDYSPYDSAQMTDPDSGASIRHYWGNQFGQNNQAYVRDGIWGSTLVPENSMRILFPLFIG